MSLIWTHNLSVGIRRFDEDHKKLIEFVNALQKAIYDAQADGVINPVEIDVALRRMKRHANLHFADEEAAMEKSSFPGLEEHRAEHLKFNAVVADMTKRYTGSSELHHADEIAQFLSDWVTDHVYRVDAKYVDHLHKHELDWCLDDEEIA